MTMLLFCFLGFFLVRRSIPNMRKRWVAFDLLAHFAAAYRRLSAQPGSGAF